MPGRVVRGHHTARGDESGEARKGGITVFPWYTRGQAAHEGVEFVSQRPSANARGRANATIF
jgi:hypothetical protein